SLFWFHGFNDPWLILRVIVSSILVSGVTGKELNVPIAATPLSTFPPEPTFDTPTSSGSDVPPTTTSTSLQPTPESDVAGQTSKATSPPPSLEQNPPDEKSESENDLSALTRSMNRAQITKQHSKWNNEGRTEFPQRGKNT
ncbi:hypothetical protein Dimus_027016, partial [Dionaea muscipula]